MIIEINDRLWIDTNNVRLVTIPFASNDTVRIYMDTDTWHDVQVDNPAELARTIMEKCNAD